jgi:hypothetical protein
MVGLVDVKPILSNSQRNQMASHAELNKARYSASQLEWAIVAYF